MHAACLVVANWFRIGNQMHPCFPVPGCAKTSGIGDNVGFGGTEDSIVREPRPDQGRGAAAATPKPGCTKQAMA